MKRVVRRGVFETNSSSTHTLTLVSQDEYAADKASEKSKYKKYGAIFTKRDKLLMACGCCSELYSNMEVISINAEHGDETDVERKRECDDVKNAVESGEYFTVDLFHSYNVYYEVAIGMITRVYCELTGRNYDSTYAEVCRINDSGRACHMKFFSEGALYDADYDYMLIDDFFYGDIGYAYKKIRRYFNDDEVLVYGESYGGINRFDDLK